MPKYDHLTIEPKWQAYWDEKQSFKTPESLSGPKFYVLDMFPYPSGAGLHVGHPEGYTATDIVARYKRANGFNVLHPMGWDAFGLPAEQFAIKTGTHPAVTTAQNVANFKRQLKALGFSYDWQREVNTTDPDYYKWTQWIFLQLYKKDLAYIAEVPVNWCPALGTVLANEEVIDGLSERGRHPVIRQPMKQWMLAITKYADRLIEDLELVDWPEGIKKKQLEWIGRSRGCDIVFSLPNRDETIRVYTTRPDTLFGATYMVLAPEHPLVDLLTLDSQKAAVAAYREQAARKSDLDRTEKAKEKSGVPIGASALNPATGKEIPIWIADYVLMSYGTGAIMAVPGHDTRDWEFADKFEIPIVEVVAGGDVTQEAYTGDGPLVNSDFLNGLAVADAKEKMIDWLEERGQGTASINYKLRDWLFSRQRYWGEPFPVRFDEDGNHHALPEEQLPLVLPEVEDYRPPQGDDPQPTLNKATEWVNYEEDGKAWVRETNTMPQWAGSCWYYLRYIDPKNSDKAWDLEKEKYWMPVDLYIGGAEHAVLHLLYARFWHKVLYDAGLVSTKEPFTKLVNQGLITALSYRDENGYVHADDVEERGDGTFVHRETGVELEAQVEKMAKSKGNVVNPDTIVEGYGADSFRLYEMFMGPLEQSKPWNTKSIEGVRRFLERIWRLVHENEADSLNENLIDGWGDDEALIKAAHKTIKGVTEDIEALRFNTAISKMMVLVNSLTKAAKKPRAVIDRLLILLNPFAPHICEELWSHLGHTDSITLEAWPTFDEAKTKEDSIQMVVQVNGKKRDVLELAVDTDKDTALAQAKALEKVAGYLEGAQIIKEVFVPGRLINFVIRPAK